MKEKALKNLGFKKRNVSAKESGANPFYYYTYEPYKRSTLSLITNCSDEVERDGTGWKVYVFDAEQYISFTKKKDLKAFIRVLEKNLII